MSQPTSGMNLHGAVDLSALAQSRPGQAGNGGAPGAGPGAPAGASVPGELVIDVTEATFGDLVQRSSQVPVLVNLTSARSAASAELTPVLEKLAREYGGRFQLANIDADNNAQVAGAFQVESLPTVVAVVGGRPVPLFQGAYPEDQLRQVLDEVLKLAAQSGVTGVLQPSGEPAEGAEQEPEEPPLPPLHAEAMAAIESGDLAAAEEAYTKALKQNPADGEAHAALLQVQLIRRVEARDPDEVLASAAEAAPSDLEVQLSAADVEATTGQFGAAFERLLAVVGATAGEDRDRARVRLVELFEIAGPTNPEVGPARRALASALY
ncbi:tetratricopeptide repeat protein [Georgenia halophila]|uniref:Tetratricopeptide repeat protein n=1 Tax=Georgenia halophila TaxID=620889 RepID=A0ABP8L142_9MICO